MEKYKSGYKQTEEPVWVTPCPSLLWHLTTDGRKQHSLIKLSHLERKSDGKWSPPGDSVWEAGKVDVSRHFGVHELGGKGEFGPCPEEAMPYPTPPIPSLYPRPAVVPIPGTAEAMFHTCLWSPQPSSSGQIARSPGERTQENQGVFKAEHDMSTS